MPEMNNFKSGNNIYEVADSKARGISLTWAQYQALSYEEQHNGTAYYITDRDAVYPVDHELNANSRNAVANDIVTPHILAMENVLGAKNLLPFDLATIKALNTSGTWSGNTYTLNGVSLNFVLSKFGRLLQIEITGTASAYTSIALTNQGKLNVALENAVECILSGRTRHVHGALVAFSQYFDGEWHDVAYDSDSQSVFTYNTNSTADEARIRIYEGTSISDVLIVKPMIRPAGTDPTYVPYAMTNAELTEQLTSCLITDVFATSKDSATAGGRFEFRANVSKAGYTPLGIIQIIMSDTNPAVTLFYINSSNEAIISARNFTSGTISDVHADIVVLYKKNIF